MDVNSTTTAAQSLNQQSILQSSDSNPAQKPRGVYVPKNDQTTKTHLEKLMRLQRGETSIQEQYKIAALFQEVNSTQDMVQLILDLESGPDPYDLSHLLEQDLQEQNLRQMVQDKIKSLMPTCSLAWLGDDSQGDLQAALMMMANPTYRNRFAAFIRLVRPLDDDAQKIARDIQTASAHCASLGWPFPEELKKLANHPSTKRLSDFSSALAKYNIHLEHDFDNAKNDFDRFYGKKGAAWIVASDTDETTITKDKAGQRHPSTHQKKDLVRGHAETIMHINKTNSYLMSQHPHFFYTITARPRLLRQKTYHTLERLASRHKDLPTDLYRDLSVKTGTFADFMQGHLRYEAYALRKVARLQAILDLWE